MNQLKYYGLPTALALLASVYIMSVLFNFETLEFISRGFIFPLFVVLYFIQAKEKNTFFAGFLIFYSLSEIVNVFDSRSLPVYYYFCNVMSVLAYFSLAIYLLTRMSLSVLLQRFKLFVLVLFICNTYILYVLNDMVLADVAVQLWTPNFYLEFFYNLSILVVLSLALLSYLYHDSKEDLLLFLGTLCIVFSEMIHVASLYILDTYMLSVLYAILFTAGLGLVYGYITSKMNTYYRILF